MDEVYNEWIFKVNYVNNSHNLKRKWRVNDWQKLDKENAIFS